MKDYQIFKCPQCGCEYYDKTARDGRKVGNPMIECPSCNKKSYRKSILEPALIGANKYFNIRFASLYGNFRIGIILIYAVFLFFILYKRDLILSLWLVAAAVVVFIFYGFTHLIHKSIFIKSEEYKSEINYSLKRLENDAYAKMVIASQGIEKDSVYFYNISEKSKKEGME